MEELNPWLDPNVGNHKNKKSMRPVELKPEVVNKEVKVQLVQKEVKVEVENKLFPGCEKNNDPKVMDFFNTLLDESLNPNLPQNVKDWAIENFDEKWLEEFLMDIQILKEDLLSSKFFPSSQRLLLLKLIFLLRQTN